MVYQLSESGKWTRDLSLRDQIRRSAVSIASNLAEGDERDTDKESIHFFYVAKGSLAELRTQLQIAWETGTLDKSAFDSIDKEYAQLGKSIGSLIHSRRDATRPLPRASRLSKGFTLLEVVLVLALLTVVFALALPKAGLWQNLSTASRQLIGTIRTASLAATASGLTHRLYLDLDRQEYWLVQAVSGEERVPTDPLLAGRVTLPPSVRVQDCKTARHGLTGVGRVFVEFFPLGRTERAVIHLSDQDSNTRTLVLDPLTADVRALERYEEPPAAEPLPERFRSFALAMLIAPPAATVNSKR